MKSVKNVPYDALGNQLNLYLPDQPAFPTLLYFHGGGLKSGCKESAEAFAPYLAARGIAVVSAAYRLYPAAHYPDFLIDAAAAAAWTKEHMADYGGDGRIALAGSSAGGYLTMMLCFDPRYLAAHGLTPLDFSCFLHDAGQPTRHFNVLREAGIDPRRVIVDESAPLFHVGTAPDYPPMLFIVSNNDMQNRYEQTMLMISTLKHFGFGEEKVTCRIMQGKHCQYLNTVDEAGRNSFAVVAYDYLRGQFSDLVPID